MTSGISLFITVRARSYIEDILQYTLETWGVDQRDKYESILYEAFDRIRQFPEIGHPAHNRRSNIRDYHLEHHIIRYRWEHDRIVILRIVSPRRSRT